MPGISFIWLPLLLSYFAILHCSKFTCSRVHKKSSKINLALDWITFLLCLVRLQCILVMLKSSKTDISKEGHSLVIPRWTSLILYVQSQPCNSSLCLLSHNQDRCFIFSWFSYLQGPLSHNLFGTDCPLWVGDSLTKVWRVIVFT